MHYSQHLCHFLNASWKSCYLRVFSTACDSAQTTSVVSEWFIFIFSWETEKWETTVMLFLWEMPWWKRKCETVCCCDATARSFVTKVRGKFSRMAEKRLSSLQNGLFGLPGWIPCEHDFALHLPHLFRSWWVWTYCARLILSSQNACLIIARVSVTLFLRFAQNLVLFLCRIHCEIASAQIHDSK
jgi:hypothetical protein